MPQFQYTALDRTGQHIAGELEGASREAVLRQLSDAGHFPIDVTGMGGGPSPAPARSFLESGRPAPATEITQLVRQLAMLLGAGLSLPRAFGLIGAEAGGRRIKATARRIHADITGGKSLAEALEARGGQFPPVLVSMVRAAEASGTLPGALERIAETREREEKLRAKLVSALLYPSFLIVTAVAAIAVILLIVVPRFKAMLADTGVQLPASTAAIIAVSDWLQAHWPALGAGTAGAATGMLLLRRQPAVRRLLDRIVLRMPIVGGLARMSLTVRFCRTLGSLLGNGVAVPVALNLTRDVMGNAEAAGAVAAMGRELRKGSDLARLMEASRLFPPIVIAVMRVGEETGGLARSALHLADMFEQKLEVATQRLVAILEPVIIVAVSTAVAAIVVSIMGAVLSVYDVAL
jgi:type II secretory pathway component PulF